MKRWMRTAQPEIDNNLAHTIVAVFSMLALVGALAAVGVALYNDGDTTVVAERGAVSAPRGKTIDFGALPGDGWKPFDPMLQPAPGGTEHAITLHAKEGQLDSLDFHASEVAPNVEMRTIGPGESLVYQFEATHSGIWMYHCGTPPVLHHAGNGMYGAVIIDPPGLAPVDHEFVFVQSELYLGGTTFAGYTKMQNDEWDAVMFNGYVNQYVAAPIRVEPGQTIRAWVLDAGPSENSSFHVIGTIFDTVYREGHYELRPDASHGGSQTLDLQPAQGGFVEFTLDHQGLYPFLTHKLSNADKGALGYFQAGEPLTTTGGSNAGH